MNEGIGIVIWKKFIYSQLGDFKTDKMHLKAMPIRIFTHMGLEGGSAAVETLREGFPSSKVAIL